MIQGASYTARFEFLVDGETAAGATAGKRWPATTKRCAFAVNFPSTSPERVGARNVDRQL